ncbi:unnamed protein product [Rotaria socialis]|uniref:Uncharacterized protein n=1 Tax=Rotaria socialis TaxID=392032 RepID=A0A817UHS2_9BILA|nr:unnamed protein product [Rotaria socialis]CAF3357008.1 unnamed protein product [Rotaria socialis]CAF3399297.1 unnamed protein product [Rotaria socialis]CAF3401634.1 unnamed protein product [Rotaria socialis]CAF3414110.1 unnamed protein product [Rotaria socialis]
MDLFALILVTITAVTICGICLFIFVCAFQPKFFPKLHGEPNRIYDETDSNATPNDNDDDLSVKSCEVVVESANLTQDSSTQSNGRDKKAYLKSLERSLRTGRRIQDEEDNDQSESRSGPFYFIRRFINKYILRRTSNTDANA